MKKMMTAVMAGIMAVSMTGCAALNNTASGNLAAVLASLAVPEKQAEAIKQDKHAYAKALVMLGNREYANKNYKKALGHYDDALKEWDNYVVYAKISYCLNKLGNKADAKLAYKKALKMAPKKDNYPPGKPCALKKAGTGI